MHILDVGSGGRPHRDATVLCDALLENEERGSDLKRDSRPFVLADIEHLPFRDHAFDYLYAVHVLEHSSTPTAALSELLRVSRAGYIETPTPVAERLYGWKNHRCTVSYRRGAFHFGPKVTPQQAIDLHALYRRNLMWKGIHKFLDIAANALYVRVEFEHDGGTLRYHRMGRVQALRELVRPDRTAGVGPPPAPSH